MRVVRWEVINRPLTWGTFYLMMIPIFAGIYALFASGFYQTSATHEPAYASNVSQVSIAVSDAVYDAIREEAAAENPKAQPPQVGVGIQQVTSGTAAILISFGIEANGSGMENAQIAIPDDPISAFSDVGTSNVSLSANISRKFGDRSNGNR